MVSTKKKKQQIRLQNSLTVPLGHVLQTQNSIRVQRTECPKLGNCVPYTQPDR